MATDSGSRPSVKELLDREGTDKGEWYGGLYDVLLQPHRETIRCVVEIGIGTLIPQAKSSMAGYAAEHYRPGGSLRAWRDFLPNAEIHGLDVAPDTQFHGESRIHTHLCDSTDSEQAAAFLATIAQEPPDLIVDDGLHHALSQAETLRNFFPALTNGGLYVIEDVSSEHVETILEELRNLQGDSFYFVDQSHTMGEEPGRSQRKLRRLRSALGEALRSLVRSSRESGAWVAIVVRKPPA